MVNVIIPFSPPYIDEDVNKEVLEVLNSGWITTGPKVKQLEDEVAKLVHIEKTVCVNSWTSGAILVLKWYGVGVGDEVIIPAYTYSATALAVLQCGAIPVMVDVKPDFTIDPVKVREAITVRTKVIMPVDIAGWPCDYDQVYEIINHSDIVKLFKATTERQRKLGRILVVSDAAHSIGSTYKGNPTGKLVDITIFSFHAVKNITTAEGGAICINLPPPFESKEEYDLMKLFSLNGQTKDAFTKLQGGGWKYDILFAGLKVNMPDICAAIGLAQIRKYTSQLLFDRERVVKFYHNRFSRSQYFELPPIQDSIRKSCFHLYALRIKGISEEQRDLIIDEITRAGVSVNVHFIPLPLLNLFKNMGYNINDYPVAYDNYSREISLPVYPQLTTEQLEFIVESVDSAYRRIILND